MRFATLFNSCNSLVGRYTSFMESLFLGADAVGIYGTFLELAAAGVGAGGSH